MRRESRGEERLVSCCGDGDVGEGDGGGFRERNGESERPGVMSTPCCSCTDRRTGVTLGAPIINTYINLLYKSMCARTDVHEPWDASSLLTTLFCSPTLAPVHALTTWHGLALITVRF